MTNERRTRIKILRKRKDEENLSSTESLYTSNWAKELEREEIEERK